MIPDYFHEYYENKIKQFKKTRSLYVLDQLFSTYEIMCAPALVSECDELSGLKFARDQIATSIRNINNSFQRMGINTDNERYVSNLLTRTRYDLLSEACSIKTYNDIIDIQLIQLKRYIDELKYYMFGDKID
jgi:hypothetical protein